MHILDKTQAFSMHLYARRHLNHIPPIRQVLEYRGIYTYRRNRRFEGPHLDSLWRRPEHYMRIVAAAVETGNLSTTSGPAQNVGEKHGEHNRLIGARSTSLTLEMIDVVYLRSPFPWQTVSNTRVGDQHLTNAAIRGRGRAAIRTHPLISTGRIHLEMSEENVLLLQNRSSRHSCVLQ